MTTTMLQPDSNISEILLGSLGARINLRGYDGVDRETRGNATTAVNAALSSGNYGLIEQTTHGKHIGVPLAATAVTAALTAANSVLLVDDAGPSIGAGRYLRLYDAAGTDYVQLSSDADGGLVMTGSSGASAGLLTVSNLIVNGNVTFTGSGRRIKGPFEDATRTNRPFFQSSATNGDTNVSAMPSGTNTISKFEAYNNSTPASATGVASLEANNTEVRLTAAFASGSGLPLQVYAGGVKAIEATITGAVTLPVAPLTLTGGQIVFPATQNPSAGANTLDDYEEGAWTPVLVAAGATTYTLQSATYTKIGRQVTVCCTLIINVKAAGASTASIDGLPFTVGSVPGTAAVNYFASSATNYTFLTGLMAPGTTQIDLYSTAAAVATIGLATFFQNAARVQLSGSYFV